MLSKFKLIILEKVNNPHNLIGTFFRYLYNHLFGSFLIKGKHNNKVNLGCSLFTHLKINICGYGNNIKIENGIFKRISISIIGNHNKILIGKNVYASSLKIGIEDDNNMVTIGNGNFIHGTLRVISIEGEKVIIGDDNLFSDDILIRNGDSHSVLNENGNRINSSKEICIGNHNWFCEKSTILKDVILTSTLFDTLKMQ